MMQADNDNIGLDEPLRLVDAVKYGFRHGGMTVSGLRKESRRGRLVIERIAGKDFTTLRAIEEMRRQCLVQQKARGCGFGANASISVPADGSQSQLGSSRTVTSVSPQAALLAKLESRKLN